MAVNTEVTYSSCPANSPTNMYQASTVFRHETCITGTPRKSRAGTHLRLCNLRPHFALAGCFAAEGNFQTKQNINQECSEYG